MSVVAGKFERTSTVAVTRGLHVLRYVAGPDAADAPIAVVRPASGSDAWVEIISAPGGPAGQLDRPGSCVVVRAEKDGALEVGVRRRAGGGSLDATLRMESLSGPETAAAGATAVPAPAIAASGLAFAHAGLAATGASLEAAGISVLAHVAMRGDVVVGENEWAAGPDSPAPIEGLEIRPATAGGVQVEMQILVVGAPRWSQWVGPGAYAGTRGRGLPLAGVRLRLAGTDANRMELSADALFLGSLILSKRGSEIELTSSTGADPLVGFKLAVRPAERAFAGQNSTSGWRERGSRVRVFSSSAGA